MKLEIVNKLKFDLGHYLHARKALQDLEGIILGILRDPENVVGYSCEVLCCHLDKTYNGQEYAFITQQYLPFLTGFIDRNKEPEAHILLINRVEEFKAIPCVKRNTHFTKVFALFDIVSHCHQFIIESQASGILDGVAFKNLAPIERYFVLSYLQDDWTLFSQVQELFTETPELFFEMTKDHYNAACFFCERILHFAPDITEQQLYDLIKDNLNSFIDSGPQFSLRPADPSGRYNLAIHKLNQFLKIIGHSWELLVARPTFCDLVKSDKNRHLTRMLMEVIPEQPVHERIKALTADRQRMLNSI